MKNFDYVIVGAGSAGCVLANRLTEDAGVSVLLLEAGKGDSSIFIQMPSALSIPMNKKRYNWFYYSEPEPHLDGRRLHCPRGKLIGGSSSINGMAYVRGNALDYDRWQDEGAHGWSYADVLPYFKKAECWADGGDTYRGDAGPLHTVSGGARNPLYNAFVKAGIEAGYPATADMNGYQQEGFGRMDMTVRNGQRWSTANGYLRPALKRKTLRVETGVLATRILFEGRKAIGLEYTRGGQTHQAMARRDVILSGGPINSPQLLQLSGIGDGDRLQALGIPVVQHRAAVGENLQDHLELYVQQRCLQPITLYSALNPLRKMLIGIEWMLFKSGLGATNHFETGGFIRSRPGVRHPDIQYHFLPIAVSYDGQSMANCHGFQAHVGPMRSRSRGWVHLASPDPQQAPRILFNYMSHEEDWIDMRACVRLTREIFAQDALTPYRGEELAPGVEAQSDADIDAFVRKRTESAFHPCGTCRMGTDADAVVDPQGKVHGIEGLRVVDSSIMPSIVSGNLNAPTIMLAEKAADAIRGRTPLPPANADTYVAPDWETAQR
ncbi:MAG: choline dehydrogenase [Alphaproteobacteria bacterium]